jgi:trehalose-6-phosphate hydrolase
MKGNNTMKWADKVVYQIYVRSFYDTDGDGVGDLRGVTEKLPYIASLGVDYIWLNPFYPSPQRDNGYDVSDYCAVDPRFGTLADFDELAAAAKKQHIGIMLDMVFNHSSTEHQWFKKALAGDREYKAYYYFRAARPDGSAPSNWISKFGGSAWEKAPSNVSDGAANGEYYLHLFDKTQADLNWYNPAVRRALFSVLDFWKRRGVAAFRFDVINLIGKSAVDGACVFADDSEGDGRRFYTDGEAAHTFIREMNATALQNGAILTVGELSSTSPEHCARYADSCGAELSMAFHFHHLKCDYGDGEKWKEAKLDFNMLRQILHFWQSFMALHNAHDALFWNNHDQPRALTRFASAKPEYHYESATLLGAAIHFMRGTPYIYMGEEIGMTNPDFNSIDDYRDVESLNYYRILRERGVSEDSVMALITQRSRDNSRTPMQWDAGNHAGFTRGTPWISAAPNKDRINVAAEEKKPDGIFAFYQNLIALRKKYAVIQNGDYTPLWINLPGILAYKRVYHHETLISMHNFFERSTPLDLGEASPDISTASVLASNYAVTAPNYPFQLRPYETLTVLFSSD